VPAPFRQDDAVEPSLPLLDCALADEFFVANTDAEKAELRALTHEMQLDLGPRLARLRELMADGAPAMPAQTQLHQIRGTVANFGLQAAAAKLRDLEYQWCELSPGEKEKGLQAAEAAMQAGLKILEERFPFLRR
jgi:hypothetical protein